jgi:hypothetical protein
MRVGGVVVVGVVVVGGVVTLLVIGGVVVPGVVGSFGVAGGVVVVGVVVVDGVVVGGLVLAALVSRQPARASSAVLAWRRRSVSHDKAAVSSETLPCWARSSEVAAWMAAPSVCAGGGEGSGRGVASTAPLTAATVAALDSAATRPFADRQTMRGAAATCGPGGRTAWWDSAARWGTARWAACGTPVTGWAASGAEGSATCACGAVAA